jgi:hypothetical protein
MQPRKLKETWSKEMEEFCRGDGSTTEAQKELIKLLEKELLEDEIKELYESKIRGLARSKWEKAGRPEGKDDHFWFEAENEISFILGKVEEPYSDVEYIKEISDVRISTIEQDREYEFLDCIISPVINDPGWTIGEKHEAVYVAIIEAQAILTGYFKKKGTSSIWWKLYLGKDIVEIIYHNSLYSMWSYWSFDETKYKLINEAKKPVFLTNLRIKGDHIEVLQDNDCPPDQFVVEGNALFKGIKAKVLVSGE